MSRVRNYLLGYARTRQRSLVHGFHSPVDKDDHLANRRMGDRSPCISSAQTHSNVAE